MTHRYLYQAIEGCAHAERAVVIVLNGDDSFFRLVGISGGETQALLFSLVDQIKRRKDVLLELQRIAGSERKQ